MDVVRFGIVGVGGMGTSHAQNMSRIAEAKLTAVADIDEGALKAATEAFDVPGFKSHSELIESGLCDAVIIATPHYFHPPIAIDAMRAGLHVISEKPMAVQVSAADEMIRVAKETGRVFAVMFQLRASPMVQAAHRIVAEGRLGPLYRTLLVEARFRSQAYYDSAGWRATWVGEGGGVLMNQAPHWMDLFVWLGGLPSRVSARVMTRLHRIEVEDEASAMLQYPNGASGFLHTSVTEVPTGTRLELVGEYGKLELTERSLRFWEVPQGIRHFSDTTDQMWGSPEAREVEVPYEQRRTDHADIVRNVARAILYGEPLLSPGVEAINQLELANAIMLSGYTGRPVTIPVDRAKFDAFLERKKAQSKAKKLAGPAKRITDPNLSR